MTTHQNAQHIVHHHHLGAPGVDYMDVLMWVVIVVALVIAFAA